VADALAAAADGAAAATGPPAAPVPASASLAEALPALLGTRDGRLTVVDGSGRRLGELTLAHVRLAMWAGLPAFTEG
jgi:hypothetical protein